MGCYEICSKECRRGTQCIVAYGIVTPEGERLDDITFNKKAAEELVRQLNYYNVSSCHARDVVEDFLFGETTVEIRFYGKP